jgi:ABC-type oligopeptide transport system ATPase subunit
MVECYVSIVKLITETRLIWRIVKMSRRKQWRLSDEKKLIDNYAAMTIQELMKILPKRSQESINNKIKRLKAAGKIKETKEEAAVKRAYTQRSK